MIQWQGASGNWYDVAGWRGRVIDGKTRWWAEEKDWGSGPFRWVVYKERSSALVATSEPFMLPNDNSKPLIIQVKIE